MIERDITPPTGSEKYIDITPPTGSEKYIDITVIEDPYSRRSEGITLLVLLGMTVDKTTFIHKSIDGGQTWSDAVAVEENPAQPQQL